MCWGRRARRSGGLMGALSGVAAADLGGAAIAAALARAGSPAVDALFMGCVLPAGQGQAPARQAGFAGGLGQEVPATTLNKMCGSGMQAVMMASDAIRAGSAGIVVAGGMESMSNAPYLLPKMRAGAGWAMRRRWTTCSWTGWRMPMTRVA